MDNNKIYVLEYEKMNVIASEDDNKSTQIVECFMGNQKNDFINVYKKIITNKFINNVIAYTGDLKELNMSDFMLTV